MAGIMPLFGIHYKRLGPDQAAFNYIASDTAIYRSIRLSPLCGGLAEWQGTRFIIGGRAVRAACTGSRPVPSAI